MDRTTISRKDRIVLWLLCGSAVAAGISGALIAAAQPPPDDYGVPMQAVADFTHDLMQSDHDVTGVAAVSLKPYPQPSWVAWGKSDHELCLKQVYSYLPQFGRPGTGSCIAMGSTPLAGSTPGLMNLFSLWPYLDEAAQSRSQTALIARGAARAVVTWDGRPVQAELVAVPQTGEPGLSVLILTSPPSKPGQQHTYDVTVYDHAGSIVGHQSQTLNPDKP